MNYRLVSVASCEYEDRRFLIWFEKGYNLSCQSV